MAKGGKMILFLGLELLKIKGFFKGSLSEGFKLHLQFALDSIALMAIILLFFNKRELDFFHWDEERKGISNEKFIVEN